jgi:molybdate transport system substrate-binding protein
VPDTRLSTAGQHVASVLCALGIAGNVTSKLHEYPNGMTAMRALARSRASRPIGCTQVTEIVSTPGVTLVRALPGEHELATVYTAAVAVRTVHAKEASRAIDVLTGISSAFARAQAGFEAV